MLFCRIPQVWEPPALTCIQPLRSICCNLASDFSRLSNVCCPARTLLRCCSLRATCQEQFQHASHIVPYMHVHRPEIRHWPQPWCQVLCSAIQSRCHSSDRSCRQLVGYRIRCQRCKAGAGLWRTHALFGIHCLAHKLHLACSDAEGQQGLSSVHKPGQRQQHDQDPELC